MVSFRTIHGCAFVLWVFFSRAWYLASWMTPQHVRSGCRVPSLAMSPKPETGPGGVYNGWKSTLYPKWDAQLFKVVIMANHTLSSEYHYILFSVSPPRDALSIRKALQDSLTQSFGATSSNTYVDLLWLEETGAQVLVRTSQTYVFYSEFRPCCILSIKG